jgi:YggT family protein
MPAQIVGIVIQLLELYKWILIIRIILSWFPAINWYDPPFNILSQLTDPVMKPFRSLLPTFGGIDFSPILLFVLLDIIQKVLVAVAFNAGSPSIY